MARLFGAVVRAMLVVMLITAPAYLNPDATRNSLEISLIIGALAGVFILFEYASSHPGLIDFRFAPPYNRARFAILSALVLLVSFYVRAKQGLDPFSDSLLAFANRLGQASDFPLSPVQMAVNLLGAGQDEMFRTDIRNVAALTFAVAAAGAAFFIALLWVFKWPTQRSNFNLWINLPTFEPSTGRDVERRLSRNGKLVILAGLATPFYALIIASRAGGWFDPSVLTENLTLIWSSTAWAGISALLVLRGAALLKIARLISRARRP